MKNINFSMIFLCYYNSKFFASEPFFIEEIEDFRGGKSKSEKSEKKKVQKELKKIYKDQNIIQKTKHKTLQ